VAVSATGEVRVANIQMFAPNGGQQNSIPIWVGTTGNKLGNATAAQLNSSLYVAGGGTAQAQTVTLTPAPGSLTNGMVVRWLPLAANTLTAPTLAVNGLAATTITKCGTVALVANDLITTAIATVVYDGTYFELQNPQAVACGSISYPGAGVPVSTGSGWGMSLTK